MENETKYLLYSLFGMRLYLTVQVKEQRPAQNQTRVLLGLYGENSGTLTMTTVGGSNLTVDAHNGGPIQGFSFPTVCPQPGETLWLAKDLEATILHAPDGTGEGIPLRWRWSIRHANMQSPMGTFTLDVPPLDLATMPQIKTTQYFTLGQTMHLTLNPCQPDLTHTLSYAVDNASGMVAEKVTGEQRWLISEALLVGLTSNLYVPGQLICDTYRGDIFLGRKQCGFYLKPGEAGKLRGEEGWCRFVPQSNNPVADSWGVCIKGESRLLVEIDESKLILSPGATLKGVKLTVDAKPMLGLSTPVLYDSTPYILGVTATDSRGSTMIYRERVTPYEYAEPTLVASACFRCNDRGAADDAGSYLWINFEPTYSGLGDRNSAQVELRLYTPGGALLKTEVLEKSGIYLGDLSAQAAYRMVLVITDALGNSNSYSHIIPPQKVAFQIREGGDGAAFGGLSTEPDCLDVHWNRLRLGGQELQDHPMEQGKVGIWTYQKWRSGLALCWGLLSGSTEIHTPAGAVYGGTIQAPDLPPVFAETPLVQATAVGGGLWWLAAPETEGRPDKCPAFTLVSPQSTTANYTLALFCVGHWKQETQD